MTFLIKRYRAFLCLVILIALASAFLRPLAPPNETLYTGVAWEMFLHHHYLVPHLNGDIYNQKPPLFFWLVALGWHTFGAVTWWPILLSVLCCLLSAYIMMRCARLCFPDTHYIGIVSFFILYGMYFWVQYSPRARLDQLLTLCVMIGLAGVIRLYKNRSFGWLLLGIGNGLGILTKGPICLIFTFVPFVFLLVLPKQLTGYESSKRHALLTLLGSLLVTIAIFASWAIPVILKHPEYAKSIMIDQTVNRLHGQQSHPLYYYLIRFPLLVLPWTVWPYLWQRAKYHLKLKSPTQYWLALSCLSIFIVITLIPPKADRFLLPMLPLFSLFLAGLLTEHMQFTRTCLNRITQLSFFSVIVIGIPYYFVLTPFIINKEKNMALVGNQLALYQEKDIPIGFIGHYDDRFQFPGRLKKPLTSLLSESATKTFIKQHPAGVIVEIISKKDDRDKQQALYTQPYRSKDIIKIWPAKVYLQKADQVS